jgi:tripartite-type tricarboxylate transporter receptor subunit TctC
MKVFTKICIGASVVLGGFAGNLLSHPQEAWAQHYPERTIEVVTHSGAGGGTDVTTRMMMLRGRRELHTDMVVVNRPGKGGAAALAYMMSQAADGHTLLTFTSGHATAIALGLSDVGVGDLRAIARGTDDPQILMARCGAFDDGAALIAAQQTDSLTYGVTQLRGVDEVTAKLFAQRSNSQMPQLLVYSGGATLAQAVVDGAVQVAVLNYGEAGAQLEGGSLCPLIVLAEERMSQLPNIPTGQELGVDLALSTVRGFAVHRDTPDDVVAQLEEALLTAMRHPLYQGYLTSVGLDETSVAGADIWEEQITAMVAEMQQSFEELK